MNLNLELVKKYFIPKKILDIGAHVGEFNEHCCRYFKDCYILSIEGNSNCEFFLKEKNINYLIYLLGEKNIKTTFFKNKDSLGTGHSIYKELTNHYNDENIIKEEIELETLDDVLQKHNIFDTFDLIKIDTQGSEIDILKGGNKTVSNAKGIILEVSYRAYNENAPLENDVIDYMNSINFQLKEELDNNEAVGQRDLFFYKNT